MSVHQVKALEESASGNNEAAIKHLSISRRNTEHSNSFNLQKVGKKFKKRLRPSWHHTKREMRSWKWRQNDRWSPFFTKPSISTSAIQCHCISVISSRQTTGIIQIKTNINIAFFHNMDHVSCVLGILNPIFSARFYRPRNFSGTQPPRTAKVSCTCKLSSCLEQRHQNTRLN